MTRRAGVVAALVPWAALALWAGPAGASDAERLAMRRVRLTTEPAATQRCTPLGAVNDDSVKDLRRKIVRLGGDTALLTFGVEDMERIYAQVFRCPAVGTLPPGVPPPPPGPPPPPPPGAPAAPDAPAAPAAPPAPSAPAAPGPPAPPPPPPSR
jgi:hypothetical protein